ncbi:MAG TPA: YtxH domain-containing protein [Phototrophicaceae bacterium]|nr:YtxH domain-containing protein [Phototrophicaceae bacterium]
MSERMYYSREAEQRAQRDRMLVALVATALGVGLGTVIALILAPQAGEDTRNQLGQQVGQVAHEVFNGVDRLRNDVGERLNSFQS